MLETVPSVLFVSGKEDVIVQNEFLLSLLAITDMPSHTLHATH